MIGRMWDDLDERVQVDVQQKEETEKRKKVERDRRVQRSRELEYNFFIYRFVGKLQYFSIKFNKHAKNYIVILVYHNVAKTEN